MPQIKPDGKGYFTVTEVGQQHEFFHNKDFFMAGDQEQVHGSGGRLRVRQLLQRPAGPDRHAPAQRQDHALLPATYKVSNSGFVV